MRGLIIAIFITAVSLPLRASLCHTISSGDFEEPSIWSCDCYPLLCDSLVIGHDVSIAGSLSIQPAYLHILPEGSLTTVGNFIINNTAHVLNDGVMTSDRILLYPCWKFENNGSLLAVDLHVAGDTLLNAGTMQLTDSLLGWPDVRLWNAGFLEAQQVFGFLVNYNFGDEHFDSIRYLGLLFISGTVHVDGTLQGVGSLANDPGGVLVVDSMLIDNSFENRGRVECRSFAHGYTQYQQQNQLYPGSLLITDDFYNGPMGHLMNGGDICIAGHSENHGHLAFGLGVCDATPAMSEPPYLDINTGTFGLWVGECANTICGTLGITDSRIDQPVLIHPNPNVGRYTVEAQEGFERIDVLDMQGRCLQSHDGNRMREQRIESSDLPPGVYVVRLQFIAGSVRMATFVIN